MHHCYNIGTCVSISKEPILGWALVLESEMVLVLVLVLAFVFARSPWWTWRWIESCSSLSKLLVHHCYNIGTWISISKEPILGWALVLESEMILVLVLAFVFARSPWWTWRWIESCSSLPGMQQTRRKMASCSGNGFGKY